MTTPTGDGKVNFNFRVEPEVAEAIKIAARAADRTPTSWARVTIKEKLRRLGLINAIEMIDVEDDDDEDDRTPAFPYKLETK